ncbi:prepilin-type N-terminal cleavage/methylation domain-containing protein [Colwellia sp. Arc7-635]|jgi:MSHA pilin protein MshA|uniref:type II secretion system protein n=1 Tax=Colwellia sp. Arc7-635 TaxID=2497879 RepID=UPI000F84F392|nr:prepilin-type N-terminal cleavage/methylation domain-containing protein [Colwellia sp. Arc7-635]AZQ85767.1 prepilin-type N-terminal cleavage/methylation domain-containing protein [Colwellia sp. Arc7-635]
MSKFTGSTFSAQKGFTLIELVVVIVILGILAATAAPKFIDLTGDAKAAVMRGVETSMVSAVSVIHAKAIIDGKTSGDQTVEVDDVFYRLYNGYPAARWAGTGDGSTAANASSILGLLELDSTATGDFRVTNGDPSRIQHSSAASNTTACRLVYTRSTGAGVRPVINSDELDNC